MWLFAASSAWLQAQATSGVTPEDRAEVERQASAKVVEALKELLDPKKIAEDNGLPYPVEAPTEPVNEVEQKVANLVELTVLRQYPNAELRAIEERAANLYEPFSPGSKISVQKLDGSEVSGMFRERQGEGLLIDNVVVPFSSLVPDVVARYNPDVATTRKKEYVDRNSAELTLKRDAYRLDIQEQVARQRFFAAGYIKILGKWVPLQEYFNGLLEARRQELTTALRPVAVERFHYQLGYVRYGNEWVNKKEADLRRRQDEFDPGEIAREIDDLKGDMVVADATRTIQAAQPLAPAPEAAPKKADDKPVF